MTTNNRIAVHKEGEEGAIHIDAKEGRVLTQVDERPEWANGLAAAMLAERVGWYERRLGAQLPEAVRSPELIAYQDLEWIGLDAEGDEVHLEADAEFRMNLLAGMMGVDRQDYDDEKNFKNAVASTEVEHTYRTQPTDEATLQEAEGQQFTETERQAATA